PSSLLALGRWPSTLILPPSMAALARLRVLKKRAAHSHLSMRTLSMFSSCRGRVEGEDFVEVVNGGKVAGVHRLGLAVRLNNGQQVADAVVLGGLEDADGVVDKQAAPGVKGGESLEGPPE